MTWRMLVLVLTTFVLSFMPLHAGAFTKSYTFSTIEVPGALSTAAVGINNLGQIVGYYSLDGSTVHGFLLDNGQFTTIDHPAGDVHTLLWGINNKGYIVGEHLHHDGTGSFLLHQGIFSPIEFPGADVTFVRGIDNKGQIVGWYLSGRRGYGFLLSEGTYSTLPDPDVPNLERVEPGGINRKGQIVGFYEWQDPDFGGAAGSFLLENGIYTYIVHPDGMLDTEVRGINARGHIVGLYCTYDGITHAFVFSKKKGFTAVDFPGQPVTGATGINGHGHVVGYYQNSDGQFGFLAVPTATEDRDDFDE